MANQSTNSVRSVIAAGAIAVATTGQALAQQGQTQATGQTQAQVTAQAPVPQAQPAIQASLPSVPSIEIKINWGELAKHAPGVLDAAGHPEFAKGIVNATRLAKTVETGDRGDITRVGIKTLEKLTGKDLPNGEISDGARILEGLKVVVSAAEAIEAGRTEKALKKAVKATGSDALKGAVDTGIKASNFAQEMISDPSNWADKNMRRYGISTNSPLTKVKLLELKDLALGAAPEQVKDFLAANLPEKESKRIFNRITDIARYNERITQAEEGSDPRRVQLYTDLKYASVRLMCNDILRAFSPERN